MKIWANAQEARQQLGPIGVWSGLIGSAPIRDARDAARRIDALGYSTLWLNESPVAREPFVCAALLLGVTERLAVATGIANIWVRDAIAARNAAVALADAYPGRFALGLGVSHRSIIATRGHDYAKPVAAMRGYLEALDAPDQPWNAVERPLPRLLAALGPRMLELARERTVGAHPYFVPVEHTVEARAALGPGPLLCPELAVVLEVDSTAARERARSYIARYLPLPNYTNTLRRLGYDDGDLSGGGSDRLVDSIVAWGDEEAVAERVREHREAGADHVAIQPVGTDLPGTLEELERLAPLLVDGGAQT